MVLLDVPSLLFLRKTFRAGSAQGHCRGEPTQSGPQQGLLRVPAQVLAFSRAQSQEDDHGTFGRELRSGGQVRGPADRRGHL
jgi:hypothetical protein